MKIGAIVLARLDSNRLNRKALIDVFGKPIIQYAFDICFDVDPLDEIILATTDRGVDDELEAFATALGVKCERGNVDDVAGRFFTAMHTYNLDGALRVNGDGPLNRPKLLKRGIDTFLKQDTDLVTNVPKRTYPYGISLEVVSYSAMQRVCQAASTSDEREHVTKYIYDHADDFKIETIDRSDNNMHGLQLAVDSHPDLERFRWIVSQSKGKLTKLSLNEIAQLAHQYEKQRIEPNNHNLFS